MVLLDDGFAYEICGTYEYVSSKKQILTRDYAVITKYKDSATVVTIPDYIDGVTVTIIGGGIFKDKSSVTNIILPNTIETIEYRAFWGCAGLTNIPGNVTSMETWVFCGCSNLTEITIPNSISAIKEYTFLNIQSL